MRTEWTKKSLVEFEDKVGEMFERGEIHAPVHLSGGNEDDLITIFRRISPVDWVFSTHRNHYHYLLKGGDPDTLLKELRGERDGLNGGCARSMNICDPGIKFYTSAIVAGNCAIAAGVALGLQRAGVDDHVWCFLGDGAEDSGHFVEAVRFAEGRCLPITFVIEDNSYSVDSKQTDRWVMWRNAFAESPIVEVYGYNRTRPHVGIGKHVTF